MTEQDAEGDQQTEGAPPTEEPAPEVFSSQIITHWLGFACC